MVKVPPLLNVSVISEITTIAVDSDAPKVFGFGGIERRVDPPGSRRTHSKFDLLEFCGFGEIK